MDSQLLTKFPNLRWHKYLFTCCYMCTGKLTDAERGWFPYLLHRDANIPKNDLNSKYRHSPLHIRFCSTNVYISKILHMLTQMCSWLASRTKRKKKVYLGLATNISIPEFGTESFKMLWNWSDTFQCSSDIICYVCKDKVLIVLNVHTNFSNVVMLTYLLSF